MGFLTFDLEMKKLAEIVLKKTVTFENEEIDICIKKEFGELTEQQRTDFNHFYKQLS